MTTPAHPPSEAPPEKFAPNTISDDARDLINLADGWSSEARDALVMFVAGVANLICMGALTALMVYEKTGPGGRRAVPAAGIALLACAVLALAHPHWLPPILGGGH